MMSKKLLAVAIGLVLGLSTLYYFSPFYYFSPELKQARLVDQLIERNIDARGGVDAWKAVSSLRLSGQMDVGQGMHLPYVLEQKRPSKMRLEFVFDGDTAVQASDGKSGWKLLPFRGSTTPEPMTKAELRETADFTNLYGLLFDYDARGISVELQGREPVAGRDAFKLKVTLPQGAVRWLYLDAETALEVKLETRRKLGGKERLVETIYHDWQTAEGILIPRRQETKTEGDTEWHFVTVDTVQVNPPLDDSRFIMPTIMDAANNGSLQNAS
jgi:hypothetical protein